MKLLNKNYVILLLILTSCATSMDRFLKDPQLAYGDIVRYKVSSFNRNICSGKAVVIEKKLHPELVFYILRVDKEEVKKGCQEIVKLGFKRNRL